MPSPKMSLRQQAAARREIRELRARLSVASRRTQVTTLTSWSAIGQRMRDEIATATRLGFHVEVHVASSSSEAIVFTAIKLVDA
jgi:hypothetical protein